MLWQLVAVLLLQQQAPVTPPPTIGPTWAELPRAEVGARCIAPLRRQAVRVRVIVRCTLDAGGTPHHCTPTTPTTLPEDQMMAVRCMTDTFKFKFPDERSTHGAEVNIPVDLNLLDQ